MRNRTVLIVEKDESSVLAIVSFLERLPFFSAPTICQSAASAFNYLSQQDFDLVILDMHLPDLTSMDVLHSLPPEYNSPLVVTSSCITYAADCFDLSVVDYLVKPFTFQRFVRGVNRALKVQFTPNSFTDNQAIFLKIGRSIQRFQYDEIDYIEAFGVYSKIWRHQKVTVVNEPISTLETHLPVQRFLRVHKSFIVCLASLTSYSYSSLIAGGTKIPLGASYRPKFDGFLRLLSSTGNEKEE
ncbi:MAG: LytTR family DNA-binding domain-containing protein [Rudanella sp.]|nr:LytTR family DNA-binding domain-containing protein [Rudanella sp.]